MRGCKPLTFDRQLCSGLRIATTRKDLKSAKHLIHAPVASTKEALFIIESFGAIVWALSFPQTRSCHLINALSRCETIVETCLVAVSGTSRSCLSTRNKYHLVI